MPKQSPPQAFENVGAKVTQSLEYEPHHDRATFDVVCAGAVDSVVLDLPAEIIARFLLWRVDSVEVGNQRQILGRVAALRENEMIAKERVSGRNGLSREAKRPETLCGEAPKLIHPERIEGEAVNPHHLAEDLQAAWHHRFEERSH